MTGRPALCSVTSRRARRLVHIAALRHTINVLTRRPPTNLWHNQTFAPATRGETGRG